MILFLLSFFFQHIQQFKSNKPINCKTPTKLKSAFDFGTDIEEQEENKVTNPLTIDFLNAMVTLPKSSLLGGRVASF